MCLQLHLIISAYKLMFCLPDLIEWASSTVLLLIATVVFHVKIKIFYQVPTTKVLASIFSKLSLLCRASSRKAVNTDFKIIGKTRRGN